VLVTDGSDLAVVADLHQWVGGELIRFVLVGC
jgi:hypothetical protein